MSFLKKSQTCWLVVQNNSLLLQKDGSFLNRNKVIEIASYFSSEQYSLGELSGLSYYCVAINSDCSIPSECYLLQLKDALSLMPYYYYSMIVKAYSVINWDKNHRFCSRCGNLALNKLSQFERLCSHCNLSFFPRISPSIIVLIKKDDQLLMARSPHFAPGIYALIAGFVDVGETIEEAVHREVNEEVGLQIKNLSYFGSQPWPFPDSLMMAFVADYASGNLVINKEEIEEANWYNYDKLPGRPSVQHSISAQLINDWVALQKQKHNREFFDE